MATPKLTTTIDERAANLAKRRVRVRKDKQSALVYGSKGAKYETTLTSCTCNDFRYVRSKRNEKCKHIARLHQENGGIKTHD